MLEVLTLCEPGIHDKGLLIISILIMADDISVIYVEAVKLHGIETLQAVQSPHTFYEYKIQKDQVLGKVFSMQGLQQMLATKERQL